MNPRICVFCGAEFSGAITARYCGPTCEKAAQRARQKRTVTDKGGDKLRVFKSVCAHCGRGFNPKHPARRYCADTCKMRAYRARQQRKLKAVA